MVALLAGKGLALAAGKPLIAVNHLEGHALSPRLVDPDLGFPYLLLLVSGGHCQLLEVRGVGDYRRLATTIDDAAGEAFDKAAKLLGLGYPGGPAIEALAKGGDPAAVPLPRPLVGSASRISLSPASRARCSAPSSQATSAPRTLPRASSRRSSIAWSTAPRLALGRRPTRPRWSSPAESPPTRRFAPRSPTSREQRGPPVQRAAGLAVHRQCGDDRLGRRRALRRRACRPRSTRRRARAGRSTRAPRRCAARG